MTPAQDTLADKLIDKLGERGFAGGDVATNPSRDDHSFWPAGPSSIGVAELVDLIKSEATSQKSAKRASHWAFLLGGAGNGKSFAARHLLNMLSSRTPEKRDLGIPKRKYAMTRGDSSVCIINDATIARRSEYADNVKVALAEDILIWTGRARKGRSLCFACVNRGIVLEELNNLSNIDRKGLAFSKAVLRWLGGEGSSVFNDSSALPWITTVDASPTGPWYRRVRIGFEGNRSICIHALAVDVGSLFDPRPKGTLDVLSDPPLVPKLSIASDFRSSAATRLESVAGQLTAQLLSSSLGCASEQRPDLCPLRANLETLSLPEARSNWLTTLRGAEIAAGRQITYRDFWGLLALSLIGPRTVGHQRGARAGSVTAEVSALLSALPHQQSPVQRLDILSKLSLRRLHMAIFRGEPAPIHDDAPAEAPPEFPAARGLGLIDPALDASRYCAIVESAVEHISVGAKPSDYLKQQVTSFGSAWRAFDSALEDELINVLNCDDTSDRQRRRLLTWLSGYLVRAVGCYVGGVGHEPVISAWYRCWHSADTANPQLPTALDLGLRTLLLPTVEFQTNMERQLTVPAFASRAIPFESAESADGALVLSLGVNHLRLRPVRRLDRLWIELVSPDSTVEAHSPLDFALLREALTCRSGSGGFTEAGNQTAPRLERARASMTSTGSRAARHYGLVSGSTLRELV